MRSERPPSARLPRLRRASPVLRLAARLAALLVALALGMALAGCGALGKKDETPTPFGPGAGVPPVDAASTTPLSIVALDSTSIGTLSYDAAYFTPVPVPPPTPANTQFAALTNAAAGLGLQFQIIFGRPDTPCRFQAALAARDLGFTILGDGDKRINDQGLEFDEVLLVRGPEHWRLDCAQLVGNVGIEVLSISSPTDVLGTPQVHYVLNSIHP